jgi:hypothetical protein
MGRKMIVKIKYIITVEKFVVAYEDTEENYGLRLPNKSSWIYIFWGSHDGYRFNMVVT